jgi:uncharacterized protein (TIGR02268 family)
MLLKDMELERREHFLSVAESAQMIALMPSKALNEGERLRMTVRFAGQEPRGATFWLVVGSDRVDRQVEVVRRSLSPRACLPVDEVASEQLQQCEARLALTQADMEQPGGLRGLWASGRLDNSGVRVSLIHDAVEMPHFSAFALNEAWLYRARGRLMLEIQVSLQDPLAPPWVAGHGEWVAERGQRVPVLLTWQPTPISSRTAKLLVEWDAPEGEAPHSLPLRLLEQGGSRELVLEGVPLR